MDTTLDITLTAEDIAALRMCEEITAHHNDGTSVLRLRLRSYGQQRIWKAKEQRLFPTDDGMLGRYREVACGHSIHGYAKPSDPEGFGGSWTLDYEDRQAACFASLYNDRDGELRSVLAQIRTGDTLTLVWAGGNNTVNLNRAALYADKLSLRIVRKGERVAQFHLATSICPDNSARMVRRKGWLSGND